jgi:hypothetical protein
MRKRPRNEKVTRNRQQLNGIGVDILLKETMWARQWMAFHSRVGDRRHATDILVRRVATMRLNHMALVVQTTVRYRDPDKLKHTLKVWKESKLRAARIYVELEDDGWNQQAVAMSAVLAMEAEFVQNRPRPCFSYCLLVDKSGMAVWKNPYKYLDELARQRDADLSGPRNEGRICKVNGHGITIQDARSGKKYFVFYNEVLSPDGTDLPPPLFVGTKVKFIPAGRTIRYTPLARCVTVEDESAEAIRVSA